MTNHQSHALEYAGYYAQGRKKKQQKPPNLKRARNCTEDLGRISLPEFNGDHKRKNESDHI